MNTQTNIRILIVGAGPTGLSAAVELARLGIIADVVERRSNPSPLSKAVGILPETIAKLDHKGIGESLRNEGMHYRRIKIFRGSKAAFELDFSQDKYRRRVIVGLPQNRTEELLREGLESYGGKVEFGKELISISQCADIVSVEFSDGEQRSYNWVIGADGTRSSIRESLGIAYEGYDLEDEWAIADVDVEDLDSECFRAWIQEDPGEFVLVLPIEKCRVRIAASTSDAIAATPTPLRITNIRCTGVFKISVRQAETYKKGHILLAGDAAHCHSPVGGRGMNLGIDDAIAAANAIVENTTESYSSERHKVGRKVLALSETGRKIVCANSPLAKACTSIAMALIQRLPFLHGFLLKRLTSLDG